jgi:hypothetical protein
MAAICHGDGLTTLYLNTSPRGIEILADLDGAGCLNPAPFHELIRPGESFGGYNYDELMTIATTRGQMDADELKV